MARSRTLLGVRTRIQLRHVLIDDNGPYQYSYLKAWSVVSALDDDTIWEMIQSTDSEFSAKLNTRAVGDGTIIGWIINFFQSPAGKMLIDLLLKLLLGGLLSTQDTVRESPNAMKTSQTNLRPATAQDISRFLRAEGLVRAKGVMDYLRMLRSLRDAIRNRDLASIVQLVKDIGSALGYPEEATAVADVILYAQQGEWAKLAEALGRFLVLVASRFLPVSIFAVTGESPVNPLEAAERSKVADEAIQAIADTKLLAA